MPSNLRIPLLTFILATILTGFAIAGCNSKQKSSRDDLKLKDSLTDLHTKKLVVNYNDGKETFKKHCNTCHSNPEKKADDLYLFDNLFDRLPAPPENYFIKYIQDSKQLILTGDKYATALDKAYNSAYEHHFKDTLSDRDFYNLLIYIKVAVRLKAQPTGGK